MTANNYNLEKSWKQELAIEFNKPYMISLKNFLIKQKIEGKIIYPKGKHLFTAFRNTPLNKVKIVIIGQDPYYRPNQAHGMCFSVPYGIKPPPSLLNIYKELQTDLNIEIPSHGCLLSWAKQGILLLNSILTVEHGIPGSHREKGWEIFTDQIIRILNKKELQIIFVLWGKYAQEKGKIINLAKHLVLLAAHPSPLSAHNGFFGCQHFSKINNILISRDRKPINWQL